MSGAEAYFIDSNVLLYSVDPVDLGKRVRALDWLDALWQGGSGRVSWQVLHEFYWNALKKMRVPPGAARKTVENLSHWRPVDTSIGLIQQAWGWVDEAQLAYWDALIVAAALRAGAGYLVSEDFQNDRRFGDLVVVNPFECRPPGHERVV